MGFFIINPQELLHALSGSLQMPHKAHLHNSGAGIINNYARRTHLHLMKNIHRGTAMGVVTDNPASKHPGAQRPEIIDNAARPAGPDVFRGYANNRYRRFRRYPFYLSPHILIQHHVANHHNFGRP